jgi:hypothetical protein
MYEGRDELHRPRGWTTIFAQQSYLGYSSVLKSVHS